MSIKGKLQSGETCYILSIHKAGCVVMLKSGIITFVHRNKITF